MGDFLGSFSLISVAGNMFVGIENMYRISLFAVRIDYNKQHQILAIISAIYQCTYLPLDIKLRALNH